MKRIAVLTSGGDCPGLNPCIRAVVRMALVRGMQVLGVHRGWRGLLTDDMKPMDTRSVAGIVNRGGTILLSSRCSEFKSPDGRAQAIRTLERRGIEGLVVLGGNGSLRGAWELSQESGVAVVGIPKTIDNDVGGTDLTLGYDTAVNTAVEAVDKIRDTATSHERLFLVEVMGRDRGFLALEVALACGAEGVLLPETRTNIDDLCAKLDTGERSGKKSSIVVVAEGDEAGSAYEIAKLIRQRSAYDVRVSVLGYLQRGGVPSAFDRVLGGLFGKKAVDLLVAGERGVMVSTRQGRITSGDLRLAWSERQPLDEDKLALLAAMST